MVFDKLKEIIVEQLGVEEDAVTLEANIQEDLGADSLDVMELMMTLGDEFDTQVDESEVENITTVGALVNFSEANT